MLTTLKIGPHLVNVVHVPTLNDHGDWDADELKIQIRNPEDAMTVFHEAVHAVSDLYGLGLSEAKVRVLESALGGVLVDNPELLEGILRRASVIASRRTRSDDLGRI